MLLQLHFAHTHQVPLVFPLIGITPICLKVPASMKNTVALMSPDLCALAIWIASWIIYAAHRQLVSVRLQNNRQSDSRRKHVLLPFNGRSDITPLLSNERLTFRSFTCDRIVLSVLSHGCMQSALQWDATWPPVAPDANWYTFGTTRYVHTTIAHRVLASRGLGGNRIYRKRTTSASSPAKFLPTRCA